MQNERERVRVREIDGEREEKGKRGEKREKDRGTVRVLEGGKGIEGKGR